MTDPKHTEPVVTQAVEWLRAISTWLLETDNDMKLPNGILDTDPLDIADALTAAEATSRAREARLREALEGVVAGYKMKAANPPEWFDKARAALTASEGGAHG